jgi:hypothetical protein
MSGERNRIRDILAAEYSFDELQQIAANMRRDKERADEIEAIFAELSGADEIEAVCFAVHQARGRQRRDDRRLDHAGRSVENATRRARFRRRYSADPAFREKCIARAKQEYHAVRADPVAWAAKLEYSNAWAKANKVKKNAYAKAWRDRCKNERPEKWSRVQERVRAADRERGAALPKAVKRERCAKSRERTRTDVAPFRGLLPHERIADGYLAGCSVAELAYAARVNQRRIVELVAPFARPRGPRTQAQREAAQEFLSSLTHPKGHS